MRSPHGRWAGRFQKSWGWDAIERGVHASGLYEILFGALPNPFVPGSPFCQQSVWAHQLCHASGGGHGRCGFRRSG